MTIAVDARLFSANGARNYFIKRLFYTLATLHETHQFIFFFNKPANAVIDTPANITTVIITPAPTNIFLYKWWYDIKISLALKKYKATIFIGTNGICSLTTKLPQLLIIPNLDFLHYSVTYPTSVAFFYKNYTPRFLKKAAAIITFSNFTKQEITDKYHISAQKITSVGTAAEVSFQPLQWQEKEKIKLQYAQGCEYFIFNAVSHRAAELINLLQAFSIFKKWQKTNMKLLITVDTGEYKDEEEKLKSYKYKNEVSILRNFSNADFRCVTAAAYAAICTSACEGFGLSVLQALQCEVPLITSADSSMAEIAGDAALYIEAPTPEKIAEQMKRIFKDEHLRNKLIETGKEQVKLYSFDKMLTLMWQQTEKVAYG